MNKTSTILLVLLLLSLALFAGYWWGTKQSPAEPNAENPVTKAPSTPKDKSPEPAPEPEEPPRVRTTMGPVLVLTTYSGEKPKPVKMDSIIRELEREITRLPEWLKENGLKPEGRDVYRYQLDYDPEFPPKNRWSLFNLEAMEDGTWTIHLSFRALYLGAATASEVVQASATMAWTLERLDATAPTGLVRGWALWRSGVGPRWFSRGILDSPLDSYSLEDPAEANRYTYGQYVWDLARSRAWMRNMSDKEKSAILIGLKKGEDPGLGPQGFRGMSKADLDRLLNLEARGLIADELEGPLDQYRSAHELIQAGQLRPAHSILTEIATFWPNSILIPDVKVQQYLVGLPLGLVDEAYSGLYALTNGDAHHTSMVFDAHLGMAETFRRQEYIGMALSQVEDLTLFALSREDLKAARRAMGLIRIPDTPYPLQERWRPVAPIGPPDDPATPASSGQLDTSEEHMYDHVPITLKDAKPATVQEVPKKKRGWFQ